MFLGSNWWFWSDIIFFAQDIILQKWLEMDQYIICFSMVDTSCTSNPSQYSVHDWYNEYSWCLLLFLQSKWLFLKWYCCLYTGDTTNLDGIWSVYHLFLNVRHMIYINSISVISVWMVHWIYWVSIIVPGVKLVILKWYYFLCTWYYTTTKMTGNG